MTEMLNDSIVHARASASAIDDPDDLENLAIASWMRHHVSFRYQGHAYVVITQSLPIRWYGRAVPIVAKQDVQPMLRSLRSHHVAMQGLRAALGTICSFPPATDDTVIDMIADAFVSKLAWLFRDIRHAPTFVTTDPTVYATLNGKYGTNVDFGKLSKWEGSQQLHGYVPMAKGVTAGKSGMTVATGFDVGQITEHDLSKLGLPPEVCVKLAPFAHLRFTGKTRSQVVSLVAARGPTPILKKEEADAVDQVVHEKHLAAAVISWNAARKPGVPEFRALTSAWQTVLFSRTFQQGTGMPATGVAHAFYTAATSGKWREAVDALQNYNVPQNWYKSRVSEEAALLRTQMPPPVQPPPGAPLPTVPVLP